MGLKAESKQLMERAGVPLVPGYHGADQDPALLQREADRIGYPVLIKASAGGGGKGMRSVEAGADFAGALASCQREAVSSFGNGAVLIEKYVQRPRHIEIQVFGDSHCNCVYLFERDCSVQRRHQKVLEEAPAPGMPEALRAQMGAAAVAAARAVNYVGAGTVEFIVEQTSYDQPEAMKFYFMEMNTRLQVEHPVTEAITGLDLVEWQLRVASGEPLPLRQDQLQITGHAIEARICAETPDKQFLPATGTLGVYALPAHRSFERADHGVRVDSGVRQGDTISPFYDSMVAKLIVHGRTRTEALARLDAALAKTHVVGLNTNVQFLRHVVRSPAFAQAQLDTALIQRESAVLFNQDPVGLQTAAAAVIADALQSEAAAQGPDPFSRRDGWQSHGTTRRRFELEYGGQPVRAVLTYGAQLLLQVGEGPESALQFTPQGDGLWVQFNGARIHSTVHAQGETRHVFTPEGATRIGLLDPLAHAGEAVQEGGHLTAPMPGKVVSFAVQTGDRVKAGQALAVMEAMKMEHTIRAPKDGTVTELLYAPGEQVAEGAELLKLG
jgi:3-methylcrotonyl-CoA carboxylase alpha subunit